MTYKRIFKDKDTLQQMLTLREKGWSLQSLAELFGVNLTSIRYQCHEHGLPLRIEESVEYTQEHLPYEWEDEHIARGKSYADYIAEAKKRNPFEYRFVRLSEEQRRYESR